jgi:hypothetical protein
MTEESQAETGIAADTIQAVFGRVSNRVDRLGAQVDKFCGFVHGPGSPPDDPPSGMIPSSPGVITFVLASGGLPPVAGSPLGIWTGAGIGAGASWNTSG